MPPEVIRRLQDLFDAACKSGELPKKVLVSTQDSDAFREWLVVRNTSIFEGQPLDMTNPRTFRGVTVVLDQEKTEIV